MLLVVDIVFSLLIFAGGYCFLHNELLMHKIRILASTFLSDH